MKEFCDPLSGKTEHQRIGRMGEDAVARHYEAEGYRVVARNVHMGHNEIDLIVSSETHIVFVEVKTRHGVYGARSRYGRPVDAVDKNKRARMVSAAQGYLREHPSTLQPRLDVAEVYMTRCHKTDDLVYDEVTKILVFRNAFGAR